MKKNILFSLISVLAISVFETGGADKNLPGYTDTPVIPGQ